MKNRDQYSISIEREEYTLGRSSDVPAHTSLFLWSLATLMGLLKDKMYCTRYCCQFCPGYSSLALLVGHQSCRKSASVINKISFFVESRIGPVRNSSNTRRFSLPRLS